LVAFSYPYVGRVYDKLKAKSLARRAAASCAKGDYKSAVLQAGKVLEIDRNNLSATRTVARSLDAVRVPVAIQWHRRLEELQPGDAENLIAWSKDALRTGDLVTAGTVLKKVKSSDQNSAVYHEVAAGVALAKGDGDAGESHLAEAVRLDPGQDQYKLSLAMLRLKSTKPQARAEALQALEELRARPETNLAALRLLIEDAANRKERAKVRELGKSLKANPNARLGDRLALLSAQRAVEDPDFFTHLEQLQAASVHNPSDFAELISWMNDHQLAIAVSEWVSKLPPELTSKPPVSLAVADAYFRSADWARLKQALESSPPDRLDFFRLALQSRMLKEQGDESGSRDAWRRALDAAKTAQEWLEKLARLAIARGWQQESEETLWALTETPSCPRWALDALWGAVRKANNTAKICRVAKLLFHAAPNELSVRGNFVYLALLTRSTQENPHALAEALYMENPGKAAIVRIYGLSLYLQGRKDEAVKVMDALPVEELKQPALALYYGIFLAANGQFDKSREYLQRAQALSMLPEEKALLANAQEALRADARHAETNAAAGGL
jgi:tetratricopeptide (TPR) repeat protein